MSPVKSPQQHCGQDVGKKNMIVVEKDEADELPPGWTKQVKTRKVGSRTKVDRRYTDPVTGYIFCSLKDAQRYVKTGKVGRLAIKPKNNECVDTDNEDERSQMEEREERSESKEQHNALDVAKTDKIVVEKDEADELPQRWTKDETDELPPGWTKEVKTRKVGSVTKVDRRYTDPVTGYIFHSLKDVQRYLKTGKVGKLASKPKNNKDERLHMEEREERSESKEQMSETLRRKRPLDKTGSEFSGTGKSELLHRASKRLAAPSPPQPEPITRQATRPAGVKTDTLLSSEPKTRQATRLVGVVVDVPPPTPTPLEYKSRQATHLAEVAVDAPSLPPPEPKTHQSKRLAEVTVDASPSSPSQVEPKTRNATRKAGIKINLPPPSPPDTRTSHLATHQAEIKLDASITSPPAPRTRQAAQQSGIKIDSAPPPSRDSEIRQARPPVGTETVPSPPSQPEPKTRQTKRLSGIRDNASPASRPRPKTRRPTRQSGIEIDAPPSSLPDTRTGRQVTRARLVHYASPKENDKKTEPEKIPDTHGENVDMDNNTNHNLESHENYKEHNNKIEMGPTTFLPPKDQAPPTFVVPPVYFGKQKLPAVNPTVINPIPQDGYNYGGNMKSDSSINFSMNDLWTDPCIEFAVKTLTGAIPCADLNKPENPSPSPLKVPLEDLWTDPCIEFAVKTLTGAIPVGEDDHLQHRPATSRNSRPQRDFYLPDVSRSFCQTDVVSKHFETGQNKQQQDSKFLMGSVRDQGSFSKFLS